MTAEAGALYIGTVVHRRLRPKAHLLRYSVFSLLLDLDRLAEADAASPLLAVNRPGILSFHEKDHGGGEARGLRRWVDERLRRAGFEPSGMRVRVLCYPRMFGYVFNPLTVYFCDDADGRPAVILYQVNNTMGERHTYVIPAPADAQGPLRHTCDKAMYVSPFTPMKGRYHFSIVPPGDDVCVAIRQDDVEGPLLNASFAGRRQTLSTGTLANALIRHPLMTLKVIAGIHLEAFKLWRKGVPVFRHTPQPNGDLSIVAEPEREREVA